MFNPFDKKIKTVYGPYPALEKDRSIIVFTFWDGSKTSMSYARWKMIQHLQRNLLKEEHVDHINDDCTDDRVENLQILSQLENNRKSNLGKENPSKGIERGWTHGTIYGWMRKKCRCNDCEDAKEEWHILRNRKRREAHGGLSRGPYNTKPKGHGTVSMYRKGCPCEKCCEANTQRAREDKKKRKDTYP